jgi:hypothetical protein
MHLLAVAPVAKGGGVSQGWDLSDLVTQRGMAIGTFDLMIRDVFLMEHLGSIFRAQKNGLVVALDAFPFGNVSVSLNHADMAFLTRHASFNIFPVIETPVLDLDVSLRLKMTRGATADGARKAFLFSLRARLVIMADEAGGLMNRQVLPLNKLGVAGSASEGHPPSKLSQVLSVREGDVLVNHAPLQIGLLVAPFLKATRIADLRVGSARFLPRDKISQRNLAIHPLALHMVEKAGLVMALRAGHLPMARSLPGCDIAIHLMARSTKGGGLREFQEPRNDDQEKDAAENQKDLDRFLMGSRASLGLLKEIDPEGLHHLIEISHGTHKMPTLSYQKSHRSAPR